MLSQIVFVFHFFSLFSAAFPSPQPPGPSPSATQTKQVQPVPSCPSPNAAQISYSHPSGKWSSGTALLDKCSILALRTPLTEPTINSFCLLTASLSTISMYVQMMKATSASCLHLGYMSISNSVLLRSGGGPWSLSSSITFSFTQSQAVLILKH